MTFSTVLLVSYSSLLVGEKAEGTRLPGTWLRDLGEAGFSQERWSTLSMLASDVITQVQQSRLGLGSGPGSELDRVKVVNRVKVSIRQAYGYGYGYG